VGYDMGWLLGIFLVIYVVAHICEAARRSGRDVRTGTWKRPRVEPKIKRWRAPVLPPAKVKRFN